MEMKLWLLLHRWCKQNGIKTAHTIICFLIVNGRRVVTDCTTTAWAQIKAYHRYPTRGSGQSTLVLPANIEVPLVDLNVAYDWNNMLNIYTNSATEQQRNAVATLMYHIALARGSTGSNIIATVNNFGYDRSIQRHQRVYYNDFEWEALIKVQLDNRLPVFYSSGREGGSHSFIVDGYDNNGKFHINWGWSGRDDGWYSLNALTPNTVHYDRDHVITINIKPDEGSVGSNVMALNIFSSTVTSVLHNEPFEIDVQVRSMGIFPGGEIGAVLVDINNNITVIRSLSLVAINSNSSWNRPMSNCRVPDTVPKGQYRLRIVTRIDDGDWVVAMQAMPDVPNSIDFEVR